MRFGSTLGFCPREEQAPSDETSLGILPQTKLIFELPGTENTVQSSKRQLLRFLHRAITSDCRASCLGLQRRSGTQYHRRLRQVDIRCPPWISLRDSLVSTGPAATGRHRLSRSLRAILCPLRQRWRPTSVSHPAKSAKIRSIWRPRPFTSLEWFPIWIHWAPLPALPLEGRQPRISRRLSFRLHSSRKSILHSRPSTPLTPHRQMSALATS